MSDKFAEGIREIINQEIDNVVDVWRKKVLIEQEERDRLRFAWQKEIIKNNELQAENVALKKYAWHKKDCMLFSIAEHPKCTCGFEQALKG